MEDGDEAAACGMCKAMDGFETNVYTMSMVSMLLTFPLQNMEFKVQSNRLYTQYHLLTISQCCNGSPKKAIIPDAAVGVTLINTSDGQTVGTTTATLSKFAPRGKYAHTHTPLSLHNP